MPLKFEAKEEEDFFGLMFQGKNNKAAPMKAKPMSELNSQLENLDLFCNFDPPSQKSNSMIPESKAKMSEDVKVTEAPKKAEGEVTEKTKQQEQDDVMKRYE
mmetsp:Transcript_2066/g.3651  ORF Transcript_2066/g.3651 Transcript_2066/m.3651 type:complete len:102 (-) Transcript_2066:454-759(-)